MTCPADTPDPVPFERDLILEMLRTMMVVRSDHSRRPLREGDMLEGSIWSPTRRNESDDMLRRFGILDEEWRVAILPENLERDAVFPVVAEKEAPSFHRDLFFAFIWFMAVVDGELSIRWDGTESADIFQPAMAKFAEFGFCRLIDQKWRWDDATGRNLLVRSSYSWTILIAPYMRSTGFWDEDFKTHGERWLRDADDIALEMALSVPEPLLEDVMAMVRENEGHSLGHKMRGLWNGHSWEVRNTDDLEPSAPIDHEVMDRFRAHMLELKSDDFPEAV